MPQSVVTEDQYDAFLVTACCLASLMALVAMVRVRSRGLSAWFQAGGFVALATTFMLVRTGADRPYVIAGFGLVAVMLAADFVVRSAEIGGKPGS